MPGDREMAQLLDDLFSRRMATLTRQLASREISIGDWQLAMRTEIRRAHAMQMIAGANGDQAAIAPNDWLRLGSNIRSQDKYLQDFARQIQSGEVDPTAAETRAGLYAKAAKTEYSKQATGGGLPTYPGQQQCLGNCGCEWIENEDGTWRWVRHKDDSCEDCVHNEMIYQSYAA